LSKAKVVFLKQTILKYIFRAVLGLLSLFLILSALLLWRLSSGPIQLNKLTPTIQRVVSNLPGKLAVRINGIELVWDRQLDALQLQATQVSLLTSNNVTIVTAPVIDISLSVSALTKRIIALSAIEIDGVEIHLVRNQDGSMRLGRKASTSSSDQADKPRGFQDLTQLLTHIVTVLESPADPQFPLSYLKTVKLQGSLTAEDRKLNMEFGFKEVAFEFEGQDQGIMGDLSLSIDGPEALAGIDIDISLLAKGKDITTDVGVSGVRLSNLSGLDARLGRLKDIDLTLAGTVSGKMTLPETIHSLKLDLSSGPGKIAYADLIPDPINIRAFNLKANADPANSSLKLTQLDLLLGDKNASGPDLQVTGTVSKHNDLVSVAAKTSLKKLRIDDLALYWPAELVRGTRNWLTENLEAGSVDQVDLSINMDIPTVNGGAMVLNTFEGAINYSDLSVYYFRPMPPATGVTGSGSFNQHGFDLSIDSGMVEGVNIGPGRVKITGLDVKKVALDVETSLEGSVADALAILESPPFHLDKTMGFSSTDTGGQLTAEFKIALPLKSGLQPKEIKYVVDANLKQASVQNIYKNYSLERGELDIHNDSERMGIKGTLDFAGIPITLDWDMTQSDDGQTNTSINAIADEIKASDISRLGYPADQYFSGSLSAEVDVNAGPTGDIELKVSSDLSNSDLSIPTLHWNKPPGKNGTASASIKFKKGQQWSINEFKVNAGTLSTHGAADYDPATSALNVNLESFNWDQSKLNKLDISHSSETGTKIEIKGGQLDLQPIIFPEDKQDDATVSTSPNKAENNTTTSKGMFNIDIGRLDKVYFSPDRFLTDVSTQFYLDIDGWKSIHVSGKTPLVESRRRPIESVDSKTQSTANDFSFDFGPLGNTSYPLSIEIDNLGSLLATALNNHTLTGGKLVMQGKSAGTFLDAPINTSLSLDNFRLVDAPIFAQVLNFASLRQTLDTMNSDGLLIQSFYGDLSWSNHTFSTELLRAHSSTVGATIKGTLAYGPFKLDLRGSVIPFDKISGFVGKIPVLKQVLTSDDGQGIVALDYTVTGNLEKPDVKVNPGSLLTPGGLRDLFNPTETKQ